MKPFKGRKSSITMYFIYIILVTGILFVAAVAAPMGIRFASVLYVHGEKQIIEANKTISQIQNETVRNSIQGIFGSAVQSQQNNIEVYTAMYQYGWIIVIVLTSLILFLLTRIRVEVGSGQGLL